MQAGNHGCLHLISIHAPREGCDIVRVLLYHRPLNFNPRTPRGVRHHNVDTEVPLTSVFQSTHPARGATFPKSGFLSRHRNFNPRTPRGVRLAMDAMAQRYERFQSTHPARGATRCAPSCAALWTNFNPRTPRGVRPLADHGIHFLLRISIHAPREGCDIWLVHSLAISTISIHAPREGCDILQPLASLQPGAFQSTHPARGATYYIDREYTWDSNFNPRTPRGVRQD